MAIRTEDTNNRHNNNETTQVLRGVGNVINAELQFFANSKKMVGTCMNCTRPQLAIIIEPIKKAFIDAKSRGVKLRYITEITRDNISVCKELMTIVDDLRHLEGIKGNFMVSDNQYLAPIILFEKGKVASQIVFSNVKELVEQEQYTFDIFWNKAIPAQDKIREIEENISIQRTQLIYGQENTTNTILQALYNTKKSWDACIESRTAPISMGNILKRGYVDARNRGVKIRYITEITKYNIQLCKEIAEVAELRHLEGIKANFGVSETEYAAGINVSQQENLVLLDHLIYSNVAKLVQQQKYIFETLWNKSIPYEQRIREIEEGVLPTRTRLLECQDEIIKEIKRLNNSANKLSICSGFGGMQLSYQYFFDSYKKILYKYREGLGLRWIINIDKDNTKLVKKFLEFGFQIKHIKNMLPMNFGVSDKEVALSIEKMEGGKITQFLISNEPLYVNHFNSVFEDLWKNGIDAAERIRDIEEGFDLDDIEVIRNPVRTQDICLDIVRSAEQELLMIFPTANAFIRQEEIGIIQLAKKAAVEKNVKVRILMPADKVTKQKVAVLKQEQQQQAQEQQHNQQNNITVDVRYIERVSEAKVTTLVVADRKVCLVMEIRDDSKTNFAKATGLSTYSNSKAGVLSYVTIFENLWIQSDLYEQLKNHDKAQREFIDIAAHELRTPIQPILGLTDIMKSKEKDPQQRELLEVTFRNAKRLQQLTEDILDVTRIESQSLHLRKQRFNLTKIISKAIEDSKNQIKQEYKKNLEIELLSTGDIFVEADRSRIYQVILNLLNNAIKFTEEDDGITITTEEKKDNNNNHIVVVSIK
ncbi:MAG: HAMP domain-containing sensor histidine kinase, partial [Candidatus Nitrosopolaris sp.]